MRNIFLFRFELGKYRSIKQRFKQLSYAYSGEEKWASKEFELCLRSMDSIAGKAVSLRSLLSNQSGKIYRQNFEADVFPSGANWDQCQAGSSFVPPAVASVSFSLQTLFFFIPAAKKKQHSPSHCVFGAPRTRFGAVKPPSSCALPFSPSLRHSSFVLVSRSLPPASPCGGVNSDICLSFSTFRRDSGYKRFISLAPASSNFRFCFSGPFPLTSARKTSRLERELVARGQPLVHSFPLR
ncbi:hypothetical protein TNCV_4448391 [Trichonephila clavipes]|nr:hypothetical protein TNCV_4448391 [Trichonephila clavipes]